MPVNFQDGNYLTDKGRALIAKCMAARTKIDFTRVTVGSGTVPDGQTPKTMLDLTNWQVDGVISEIDTPVPGEAQITFQVFSQDVAVGFFASEAAVWANDPDEGEIVYTYIVIANEPEWIRASNNPVQKFAEFTCISIIDAAQVDVTQINPKAIVTFDALEERLASVETSGAGIELSDQETPSTGAKVHMRVLERVVNWFKAPGFTQPQDAFLTLENGQTVEGVAQLDSGETFPLQVIPENSGN